MLIGFAGAKGSGKTTAGNYLQNKGFVLVSFAEPLKKITAELTGIDIEILNGETAKTRTQREIIRDQIWGMTGREALQCIGTEVFRNHFDKDIWIKLAKRKVMNLLARGKKVCVTDVRFLNEFDMIKMLKGRVVLITRNGTQNNDNHISEIEYLKFPVEHKIINDHIEDFYKSIDLICK